MCLCLTESAADDILCVCHKIVSEKKDFADRHRIIGIER